MSITSLLGTDSEHTRAEYLVALLTIVLDAIQLYMSQRALWQAVNHTLTQVINHNLTIKVLRSNRHEKRISLHVIVSKLRFQTCCRPLDDSFIIHSLSSSSTPPLQKIPKIFLSSLARRLLGQILCQNRNPPCEGSGRPNPSEEGVV